MNLRINILNMNMKEVEEKKQFSKTIKQSVVAMLMAFAMLLTACSFGNTDAQGTDANTTQNTTEIGSMEDEAIIDYETPTQLPGIIADRDGYSSLEVKYAWVVAEELPATFYVVNDSTGEIVLETGPEIVRYEEDNEIYHAKIRFSDVKDDGDYHIEESSLGKSYSFTISNTYFEDRFIALVDTELGKLDDESISYDEIIYLLYACERYSGSLKNGYADKIWDAIKNWIELKNLEDIELALIDKGASSDAADGNEYSKEDLTKLAIILAKFGWNYNKTDADFAKECIDNATKIVDAYVIDDKNDNETEASEDENISDDLRFFALAENYRATLNRKYGNIISGMESELEDIENIHLSRYILFGSMTYMSTNATVNRGLCDFFMQELLDSCEVFSQDKTVLSPINPDRTETEELLGYAQELVAMNYILDGYQYNELIVSIMHYMSGRNYEGYVCDIETEYPEDSIVILSWLSWIEKNGKMDPEAPVVWQYSW